MTRQRTIEVNECCPSVLAAPLSDADAEALAHGFAALADPIRLKLLSIIASADEICACDLVEPVARSQPTVSHHLRTLFEAGLVERERRGTWIWYSRCRTGSTRCATRSPPIGSRNHARSTANTDLPDGVLHTLRERSGRERAVLRRVRHRRRRNRGTDSGRARRDAVHELGAPGAPAVPPPPPTVPGSVSGNRRAAAVRAAGLVPAHERVVPTAGEPRARRLVAGPAPVYGRAFVIAGFAVVSVRAAADNYFGSNGVTNYAAAHTWVDREDTASELIGFAGFLWIAVAVLMIIWAFQFTRAVDRHHPSGRRWTPGWAIGAWFIPLANYFLCPAILMEDEKIALAAARGNTEGWKASARIR